VPAGAPFCPACGAAIGEEATEERKLVITVVLRHDLPIEEVESPR
jgi:hypothetical protein